MDSETKAPKARQRSVHKSVRISEELNAMITSIANAGLHKRTATDVITELLELGVETYVRRRQIS